MRLRRAAGPLAALVLAAGAFGAGFLAGRREAPKAPARVPRGYEIREGRRDYLNPLLECEVDDAVSEFEVRPFGRELDAVVGSLEKDPQVERIAAYYRDLDTGAWVGHHEQDAFVPASLAKVPVMLACLRQAEDDPAFLARRVVYPGLEQEREPGFLNPEVNLERGKPYTIRELIRRVAQYSDNAAARLLAATVDPSVLAAVSRDLGLPGRSEGGEGGRISPKQYGSLFRVLYNASYLSRGLSTLALDDLASSSFELGLVAGVPESVVVSHKYGVWESPGEVAPFQLHDCGIVYHPARPYLLCVMTSGSNYVRMAAAIGEVSRFVYRRVDQAAFRPGKAGP